jgi:hypothetical protein
VLATGIENGFMHSGTSEMRFVAALEHVLDRHDQSPARNSPPNFDRR